MVVFVEHQRSSHDFAVYVGGDDDFEGDHDRLFSYGRINDRLITEDQARSAALDYAMSLAKRYGGLIEL